MATLYRNRVEAGQQLATTLTAYAQRQDTLILALPRGGVPVAYEVSKVLHVPLDIFIVRKLGVPGREELAMGAIATGDVRVLNAEVIRMLQIPGHVIEAVTAREQRELERREQLYRDGRPSVEVRHHNIILIDDGLATGATMRAAIRALRLQKPTSIIVAVPVAAPATCSELSTEADEIICANTPDPFFGVGWWYEDFSQTSDEDVHDLLARANHEQPSAALKP
ncbi:phosphoribosyltransferase [Ktedonosporobacter rubrisoli]|uniref:Phosphoribosyltransferase n=1 Tax=Ktedonosporobacter rubrisoli TaxID=2509675 RepID=A0A4P6JUP9_KTERU|nr:phosphoribosyltransferase [Ktedonosporobacter rubrisoli]QBD78676.1 phosphoribosyltransferase [Ktedonosporobacter rubrisoli]